MILTPVDLGSKRTFVSSPFAHIPHRRLLVAQPQPCAFIIQVGRGAKRLIDRHAIALSGHPLRQNSNVDLS